MKAAMHNLSTRRKVIICAITVVVVFVGGFFASKWLSTPSSFEDCILRNAASANGSAGTQLVWRACRGMFPAQKSGAVRLSLIAPAGYTLSADGLHWVPAAHIWNGVEWDPPLSITNTHQFDEPKQSITARTFAHYLGGGVFDGLIWFTVAYLALRGTMRRSVPTELLFGGYIVAFVACGSIGFFMRGYRGGTVSSLEEAIIAPLFACLLVAASMYRVSDWRS